MKDGAGNGLYALFTTIVITPQHSTVLGLHRSITGGSLEKIQWCLANQLSRNTSQNSVTTLAGRIMTVKFGKIEKILLLRIVVTWT